MRKNMGWVPLFITLAVILTLAGVLAGEAAAAKLTDTGEASWARQAITEMCASEIISGYPEGVFKPYKSVSRLEAVAMLIRVLGLEEQAKELDKAEVDYKIPTLFWGRGYLIMGVQKGMLDKDHLVQLEPAAPATRAEVAALVCLALKLNAGGSTLTFADSGDVPQSYQDYVAAVVKSNIMTGLPGNVFKPNDEINRAQMAVLLSRIVENNFAGDAIKARRSSGTLSTISPVDSTHWLLSVNGSASKIVAPDCEVILDGKSAGPADLKAGDAVKLVLNKSDQVAFIGASRGNSSPATNNQGTTYRGKVNTAIQAGGESWLGITAFDGTQLTRQVAGSVKVNDQGNEKEVSSLSKGDYVEIKVDGNKIIEINSLATTTLKGTVTATRSSGLTVRSDGDTVTDLNVSGDVTVAKNNSAKAFGDIKEGDRVEVTVLDNKALRIDILSSPNLEGEIREINTSGTYLITIRSSDGDVRDYVVQSDVEVTQNGSRLRFEDLRVGDQVKLELNSTNRVTYIELAGTGSNKLTGAVKELDAAGTWGITIRDDDGYVRNYVVDSNVEVKRNGSHIRFQDLNIGEHVKLELNSRDQVDYIETTGAYANTFSGTIADLGMGDYPWIKITKSDGSISRYNIADSYTFYRKGESLRLKDIVIGSEVKVQVAGGKVTNIDVANDTDIQVTGEVTYVYTDSKKILIKQLSGNEFSYYLADGAVLKDNIGRSIGLGDVSEGWEVELALANGKVYRLTRQ